MEEREIDWIGEVNEENMQKVIEQIRRLQREKSSEPIWLYITSEGGKGSIGRAFYEWVQVNNPRLETIGVGKVSSAAILILLAGRTRKATPNTIFEIHEIGKGSKKEIEFTLPQMKEVIAEMELSANYYCKIVSKKTKISKNELIDVVKKDLKDLLLTAEEAKEKGIIDEIIS